MRNRRAEHPVTSTRNLVHVVLWMTGTLLSFCVMAVSIRALAGALSIVEILTRARRRWRSPSSWSCSPRGRNCAQRSPAAVGLHFAAQQHPFRRAISVGAEPAVAPARDRVRARIHHAGLDHRAGADLSGGAHDARAGLAKWCCGLAGVLVIVRPGIETFQPAALLVLAAAFGYAHAEHRHQEADDDRKHVRHRVLDERHPVRAWAWFARALVRRARSGSTNCRPSPGSARPGCLRISA